MSIHRTGVATAFVVAILAAGTACGTEITAPPNDISGGNDATPSAPGVDTRPPAIDDRRCTSSIRVAKREHRTLCAV